MKNKLLKKIAGLLGYKLIDKKYYKNKRSVSNITSLKTNLILENLFLNYDIKKIIQIGANDGDLFDELNIFIKKYKPESLLVEPIKYIFENLKINYKNFQNVKLDNSAISVDKEISSLYRVKDEFIKLYDSHIKAISSFEKKHLLSHGVLEKHLVVEKVDTITIKDLILKYNFNDFDLLYLDVEGYDGKIVKDFLQTTKMRPFIIFEYIHISNSLLEEILQNLNKEKYKVIHLEENIFCCPESKKFKLDLNIE